MADIIINQIENKTKIEVLIGLALMSLITLLAEKIYVGEAIPIELFWGLAILLVAYVALILLTYIRFYIEKMVFFKEQEVMVQVQTVTLDKEISRLGLVKEIRELEAKAVG